jgi:hypothetical protein
MRITWKEQHVVGTPVILAFGRLRQEDSKFEASLVYIANIRSA